MGPPHAVTQTSSPAESVRDVRRQETRARLFDTAVVEIGRSGLAGADVSAIAGAAGVVRGTFYFHFPTKEHVLVELERNEELKIVGELAGAQIDSDDLVSVLSLLVRHVLAAQRRLGPVIFRDMLGLHFSSSRPVEDGLAQHPLAEFVIAAIAAAQGRGHVPSDTDASEVGVFFMTGLYALLAAAPQGSTDSEALLTRYVTTIVKGVETR